jgi:MinD superfamily P-loop ATPase
MKQLLVLSGKGGTGKTTIAASFIKLAKNKGFADCDVDAPNLHLIHGKEENPEIEDYYGYQKSVKYDEYCTNCGKCEEACQFGALKDGKLNPFDCEGCGVCEYVCPSVDPEGKKAIRLEDNVSGQTMLYTHNNEIFSSAYLNMGNGASGKLVSKVRENLKNKITNEELIIIDGSPGIGCPVIASITGVDMVLIVTEPTISGIHDMKRIVDTTRIFGVKCIICVNKYDVNIENTNKIKKYCDEENIPFVGEIPYDKKVLEAVNMGKSIIDMENSEARNIVVEIWDKVYSKLSNL